MLFKITIFFISFVLCAECVEVRVINPPKLSYKNLGKRLIGYRPMRKSSLQLKIEVINDKIIAHNYGHGGSGWTLAPGSSAYVIGKLHERLIKDVYNRKEPITIIGAGILGLFSAVELLELGYTNIKIIADDFNTTTSHMAGGLLAPVSMSNNPDVQELINKMVLYSYKVYSSAAQGDHKIIKNGCRFMPSYFTNREESGLEPLVKYGVLAKAKDVELDFGNGTRRKMISYDDGLFIDTGLIMVLLRNYLESKGVSFIKRKIKKINELSDNIIVNASGYGAKNLFNDNKMVSVQGHLVMLEDQNPKNLEYMIIVYLGQDITSKGYPIKRSFYIFPKTLRNSAPKNVATIGGTFIEVSQENNERHEEEFDKIITQAKEFYGIK